MNTLRFAASFCLASSVACTAKETGDSPPDGHMDGAINIDIDELIDKNGWGIRGEWKKVPQLGPSERAALLKSLADAAEDPKRKYRHWAVNTLARLDDPDSVSLLLRLLESSDESVRAAAIEALESIGSPAAFNGMLDAFRGASKKDKKAITKALRHHTKKRGSKDVDKWRKLLASKPEWHDEKIWRQIRRDTRALIERLYSDDTAGNKEVVRQLIALGQFAVGQVANELNRLHMGWRDGKGCSPPMVRALASFVEVLAAASAKGHKDARFWIIGLVHSEESLFGEWNCDALGESDRDRAAESRVFELVEQTVNDELAWPENLTEDQAKKFKGDGKPDAESPKFRWYVLSKCCGDGYTEEICDTGSYLFDVSGQQVSMLEVRHDHPGNIRYPAGGGWTNKHIGVGYVFQDGECCGDETQAMVFYALGKEQRVLCRLDDPGGNLNIRKRYKKWLKVSKNGCSLKNSATRRLEFVDFGPPDRFLRVRGVASDDVLHVRKYPHANAEKLSHLEPDERCVRYTGVKRNVSGIWWHQVTTSDGTIGWSSGAFLKSEKPAECSEEL
ncbi:HEAT repeat domain-containing protein [Myxococcota bacterium]